MSHADPSLPISNQGITDEQLAFARTVRTWAEREVMGQRQSLREDFDRLLRPALRSLLLDLGLQHHLWPEAQGGDGADPAQAAPTLALALEQAGRADTGLGFVASACLAPAAVIAASRDDERIAGLAPLFCRRDREVLLGLILPALGQRDRDPQPLVEGRELQARARLDGDEWIVDAENARPFSCGLDADLFAVLCRLEGADASPGLILVPADRPGIRRGERLLQTGLAPSRGATVTLADVRVPQGHLAASGLEAYRALRTWLCLGLAATCSGALLAAREILGGWAESRVIKGRGQRFVDNPLCAAQMADLVQRSALVRIALLDLARLLAERPHEAGEEPVYLSALSVAHHTAAMAETGLNQTMELMASAGYATEWNLERYWRDIKTLQAHLGAEVLDRMAVARYCFGSRFAGEESAS